MDSTTGLILSILFGSVGFAYFVYGKKQGQFVPMLSGMVLCVYPYFVSNIYVMLVFGVVLIVLPFRFKA